MRYLELYVLDVKWRAGYDTHYSRVQAMLGSHETLHTLLSESLHQMDKEASAKR